MNTDKLRVQLDFVIRLKENLTGVLRVDMELPANGLDIRKKR